MGMIVPMSPGQKPNAPAQAMPSQTDLLMALADMHKNGAFDQHSMPFIQPLKPGESGTPAQITETAKRAGEKNPADAVRRTIKSQRPDASEADIDDLLNAQPGS